MKIILLSFTLFISVFINAQSGVVILTEEFTTSGSPLVSEVHVTMPNGNSSTTSITHEGVDVAQHDIDLNNIINNITNQGYQLVEFGEGWGFFGVGGTATGVRRLFFGNP